ncbi:energy-coupling factor transporter transmembrane component T [Paenibacillus eucommiae]|uniref:Energy-coupling factor transport system permease protein n=1 Tax=Paenibacillus eucommiae TaxID=1355755 RepID=A0ABS4INH6_9BACL|nr:energy-coupling factor transporter transmembrane component T [Paenibacillus eucommiae]MBP1989122.1 energy-coupling factor transport system permease protein [Paenibacillus eucommiae]
MNLTLRHIHPIPCFFYYTGAVAFCFLFQHPWFLLTSAAASLLLNAVQGSLRAKRKLFLFFIIMSLVTLLINPLLSHRGAHILFYFWDQPITLEAVIYGVFSAFTLFAVLSWFVSIQHVFSSDKILHLFGSVSPKGALLLSMALRSFPLLTKRFRQIAVVQRTKGVNVLEGSLRKRLNDGMKFVQLVLTWTLEEGLQTADSMKARGYGSGVRTQFWPYTWKKQDLFFTLIVVLAGLGCLSGWFFGLARFEVYPRLSGTMSLSYLEWAIYGCFFIYFTIPLLMEGVDLWKWRSSN